MVLTRLPSFQLIMLRRMMKDLQTFGALILVFLLGFGVATTGLMFPAQIIDQRTPVTVVYQFVPRVAVMF
jgi:hypothetical protein